MASLLAGGEPPVSRRHGVRCVPAQGVSVEDVLLAVGEEVGYDNISSASRMNKAVVVFVKEEKLVNRLIANGIVVGGDFVIVSPLVIPTTKVYVSNVPPFIRNEDIERALVQYGKCASAIKTIPLGCKSEALKHVMSFRRQVFMFLNVPELDVSFRVVHEGKSYMLYVNTGSLKCFECGELGHKKLTCPHRAQTTEEAAGPSGVTAANVKNTTTQSNEESIVQNDESCVSVDQNQNEGEKVENVVQEHEVLEHSTHTEKVSESVACEVISIENTESLNDVEKGEEYEMREDDTLSEVSDVSEFGSQNIDETYSVQEINDFLDLTFGKTVEVKDFFPEIDKFIGSVVSMLKVVSCEALCKKKRFRLKKMLAKLRKEKRAVQK